MIQFFLLSTTRCLFTFMIAVTIIECGKRYSEATVHNGVAYLAGQVPENTEGQGIMEQTQDVLNIIDKMLTRAGTDKSHILMATIYLVDMSEYAGMNEVWDKWVTPEATPARATVEVTKLANPGWKLEIVVTAALPTVHQ
ncbi:hypothetical protein CEUSTIGMA_g10725.t1 [Chlamydomonas eustigma]|uniref:Uncharacterized protein n=1 Tax=Chlamydomonas eustigma TaxID=1157962 RepID=A0A250XK46_9CHLO|nr:hypothetical protein CEUSTIGMA_g10725.t1 [Chlamydomonas eustigma]|eukprot:GAX83299.1 hypothetical protein CEUSTIGMA_g10725.t1 [Chlamydomonas eustigma]